MHEIDAVTEQPYPGQRLSADDGKLVANGTDTDQQCADQVEDKRVDSRFALQIGKQQKCSEHHEQHRRHVPVSGKAADPGIGPAVI